MDLITLAVAQKYADRKIAEAAVGGVDVTELVTEKVAEVVGTATESFDTLGEMETAINNKVDKVSGKGLSTNDFTNAYKTKLDSALTSYTETDPTVPAWAKAATKPSYSYSEITDTPTVPTKTSELTNDSGFITDYTETDPTVPDWAKATTKPTYTATEVGAVPTTRTVNSKALSANITLSATDVGAVPTTRTVNGHALSANITLSASDVGALPSDTAIPSVDGLASETYVDNSVAALATNLILNSSTEGSTKKFKITVDDSGVLTATEVVE